MKKVLCFLSICISLLYLTSAYAALDLELTKGIASAIPIAIVPFKLESSKKPVTDISKVIMQDLANSGEFKPLNIHLIKHFPSAPNEVNFDEWRDQKVNYVAVGTIKPLMWGRFKITFALLDVYKGANNNSGAVIVNKVFEVKGSHLRQLAHRIADIIYEQITGVKGIFSTKIAYVLVRHNIHLIQYDLMVADADGRNAQAILTSDEPILSPRWSPDGKKIAYVSLEGHRASIYVSDVESGRRELISQQPGINGAPAWSPDGRQLAIVLSKGEGTNIYLINAHGGDLKPLTHGFSIDTEPCFSPDGQFLLFTSDRGGSPQIYRMNLKTEVIKRLTFNGRYNASASLTPNGSKLVLLHRERGQYDIAVQDLDTDVLTVLTHSGYDQSPSVSPNGRMIIYASQPGDKSILNVVSIDGKVSLALPEADGEVREPAWGPLIKF